MKTKLIRILSFIVLLTCYSTVQGQENDLEEMKLNGKVLSLKEISYEAVIDSGIILNGKLKRQYPWDDDNFIRFDIFGNIDEKILYEEDGGIKKKKFYKYDYRMNKIEEKAYGSSNELQSKYTYKYDESGNCIGYDGRYFDPSSKYKYTYKYDDKGNKIESNSYDDGVLDRKSIYNYDENSNNIEIKKYNSDGDLWKKWIYKYDDRGNSIETNQYDSDNNLKYIFTSKYDDKNNIIEKNRYNPSGSLDVNWAWKYEFDMRDNWTKRVKFKNKIPTYILIRTIEYYDSSSVQAYLDWEEKKLEVLSENLADDDLADEKSNQFQIEEIAKIESYSIGETTVEQFFKDGWNVGSNKIGIIGITNNFNIKTFRSDTDTTYVILGYLTETFDTETYQDLLDANLRSIHNGIKSYPSFILPFEVTQHVCLFRFDDGILKHFNWAKSFIKN